MSSSTAVLLLHRIDDCEQLASFPTHIAKAVRQAVQRHCVGYAKKRLAALNECTSKCPPPLVAAICHFDSSLTGFGPDKSCGCLQFSCVHV